MKQLNAVIDQLKLNSQPKYGDTLRNDEAREQSNLTPTQICNVFSYVNKFIELLRISNEYCEKNVRFEPLVLDNTIHTIMDNGII